MPNANKKTTRPARPYRSHKFPACSRCHKRRTRCTIEVPGEACLLCRMHEVECSSTAVHRYRGLVQTPNTDTSRIDNATHILSPVLARDKQVLDELLPQADGHATKKDPTTDNLSQSQQRPVYQSAIPRRRASLSPCGCSRNRPQELAQSVNSILPELISLYLNELHPALPLLDETCLQSQIIEWTPSRATFIASFVAYTLCYRSFSTPAQTLNFQDPDSAWSVVCAAENVGIEAGGILAITVATLNVAGRPSKGFIHNTINVAKIVALSNSIGLNHDCSGWKLSEAEKVSRWKLWWAVLIHDRWLNFAHGTPPYINKTQYDVPLPTRDMLVANHSDSITHVRAAECYIQLCRLTEIVGDVLPLIHQLRSSHDTPDTERILKSESDLDEWLKTGPAWLDMHDYERPKVPGLINLQLSYLSTRMLIRRISWHEVSQRDNNPPSSWLTACYKTAEDIVTFVLSLKDHELASFWLPYNAHHFTSAVTLLLRCGVQTSDVDLRMASISGARQLVDCLHRLQHDRKWDMAEHALTQSQAILKRIEEALPRATLSSCPANIIETNEAAGPSQTEHNFWQNPALQSEGFGLQDSEAIEELFPGLISEHYDASFFGQASLWLD